MRPLCQPGLEGTDQDLVLLHDPYVLNVGDIPAVHGPVFELTLSQTRSNPRSMTLLVNQFMNKTAG